MIKYTNNGVEVCFGGTVGVVSMMLENKLAVLRLSELKDDYEVGCDLKDKKDIETDTLPALLVFDKPESIDVVITHLQAMKEELIKLNSNVR